MIDFRFDPFLFQYRPKNIIGETKTVQYFSAFKRVGFFLDETPQRLTSAPMVVVCGGDTLGEVPRSATPGADNFRVDYGNVNNFAATGFVEIHVSRIGQIATINQRGLGANLNSSHREDARANLQRSARVMRDTSVNSLRVPGSLVAGADISAGLQRVRDLTAHTNTDLVTLATFLGMTTRTTPQILTGSGNWSKPSGVRKVFFVLIGPGGSGHADGGGGGGGASVYGVADLDAIGGDMFAYVVGVVGIATTMFGCVAGSGASATNVNGAAGGTGSVGSGVDGVPVSGGYGGSTFYIAGSDVAGSLPIATSVDAAAWDSRATPLRNYRGFAFGNNIIVAITSTTVALWSNDGINWTEETCPEIVFSVTYGNGLFVAVGIDAIMTSPDGKTWTSQTSPQANTWMSVTYGAGLFVVVSLDGTNRVATSPDGVTWTLRNAASASQWLTVTFGNNLFVSTSNGSAVQTSSDGIIWNAQTGAAANQWLSLAYGNSLFAAVTNSATASQIMTSPDGVTWTLRPTPVSLAWRFIGYGNGQFVTVGETALLAATNQIMTSSDGITWNSGTISATRRWSCVAYIPYGGGGGAAGGFGGNGQDADSGAVGNGGGFFSGAGGLSGQDGENFGGGGGANGTGAEGLILLVY